MKCTGAVQTFGDKMSDLQSDFIFHSDKMSDFYQISKPDTEEKEKRKKEKKGKKKKKKKKRGGGGGGGK